MPPNGLRDVFLWLFCCTFYLLSKISLLLCTTAACHKHKFLELQGNVTHTLLNAFKYCYDVVYMYSTILHYNIHLSSLTVLLTDAVDNPMVA